MITIKRVVRSRFLTEKEIISIRIQMIKKGYKNTRDLAVKIGVSESYLSLVLHGKRNVTRDLEIKFNTAGIAIR